MDHYTPNAEKIKPLAPAKSTAKLMGVMGIMRSMGIMGIMRQT